MGKIDPSIKQAIEQLPKKELEKLVLKVAQADKQFHDYLIVNYADKEFGEQDLFKQAQSDIDSLLLKKYKGYSNELRGAKYLAACNKRITTFGNICKKKELQMDLIMGVLDGVFSTYSDLLGTCFTSFDYQTSLLLKKAISLLQKKLHEDFRIEYEPKINKFLTILHSKSNHLDSIYRMPANI